MVYYLKKWYRQPPVSGLTDRDFFILIQEHTQFLFDVGRDMEMTREGKGPGVVLLRFFHILVRYAVLPVVDNLVEKDFSAPGNDPAQAELFGISCMDIKKRSPNHRLAVVLDLFKNRLIFRCGSICHGIPRQRLFYGHHPLVGHRFLSPPLAHPPVIAYRKIGGNILLSYIYLCQPRSGLV